MDIPKNQSWVSLHPLSSPLHLVPAKPLPAADPAKGIEQEGILGGLVFTVITAAMAKAICNKAARCSKPRVPASTSPLHAGHLQQQSQQHAGCQRQLSPMQSEQLLGETRQEFGAASARLIAACSGDGWRTRSRAATHLCLLHRPSLSAQALHPSVKKDVSHLSGMLKPPAAGLEL